MKGNIAIIVSILSMLTIFSGCSTNYSKAYHPSRIKIFTFEKYTGYQHVIKTINNQTKVHSIWGIIQHMKKIHSYQPPADSLPPRLCFDFSSNEKPNYNCFDVNEEGENLILTEMEGDTSRHHFQLSKSESDKIKKLYK